MKTEITCVYDRKTNPGIFSKLSHGVSFYIKLGEEHILFDMGLMGRFLMRNLNNLEIDPNIINKIIISHGHSDHVGGLRLFLENRTNNIKVPIYAHSNLKEPKRAYCKGILGWNAGFYHIEEQLEKKVEYKLSREPFKINEFLFTTGEIPFEERQEFQNVSHRFAHKVDGKWEIDPVLDDTSLYLKTKKGIVLICGDCHSGLVNTIRKVERLSGDRIITLIGAIHIIFSKKSKMLEIVDDLLSEFNQINFHINHSVGRKCFRFLQNKLGKDRIQYFPVGKTLILEC